jgi:hypothetical protein
MFHFNEVVRRILILESVRGDVPPRPAHGPSHLMGIAFQQVREDSGAVENRFVTATAELHTRHDPEAGIGRIFILNAKPASVTYREFKFHCQWKILRSFNVILKFNMCSFLYLEM